MIERICFLFLLSLLLFSHRNHSWAEEGPTPETRAEFIRALKHWEDSRFEGTDKELILHLVGKPDDILVTGKGVSPGSEVKEAWCYGTDRHQGFPTLGRICFGKEEEILRIDGLEGRPPSPEKIQEEELRYLLRVIDDGICTSNYDPFTMVRTVNTLHAVGEDTALLAIMEYLRVTRSTYHTNRQSVIYILHLLYDVPEQPGYFVKLPYGAPKPSAPKDKTLLPRFPMWVYHDIPFLISGYELAGSIGPIGPLVSEYTGNPFRDRPLKPTDDPFALLREIDELPQLNFEDGNSPEITQKHNEHRKWLVRSQLLHRFAPEIKYFSDESELSKIKELMQQKLRWNAKSFDYDVVK